MKRSDIGWTDYSGGDANFVLGCSRISAGCQHCYMFTWADKYHRPTDPRTYPDKLTRLSRARFDADGTPYRRGSGSRPMVFLVDMGDLFHDLVPADFIHRALTALASRSDVDWQILTKRPARMARVLADWGDLPPNVWCGVTAEDQRCADERLPILRTVKAGVRFVSVEPMIGPIKLDLGGVNWVICGGESGADRRPFEKSWAADLQWQCQDAGVPFLFKQGSAFKPGQDDLLGGQCVKQWPEVA